jgi:hypothetical protein
MALQVDQLVTAMTGAAQGLPATVWSNIQTFAVPEFQKIATQIVSIETGMLQIPPAFTQDGAKALLDLQLRASIGIIVAMTTLTLLAVQNAINQVVAALKGVVNTAIGFTLVA